MDIASRHTHGKCKIATGECGCNCYDSSIQCMGYAKMLADFLANKNDEFDSFSKVRTVSSTEIIREKESGATKNEQTSSEIEFLKGQIKVGDYIRNGTNSSGHSLVIVGVSDSGVEIGECNWVSKNSGSNCIISWKTLTWAELVKRFEYYSSPGYIMRITN